MKATLTILLALIAVTGWGQIKEPFLHYSFDNTLIDSMLTGNDLTAYGNASFANFGVPIGSHNLMLDGNNDYVKTPTLSLGDTTLYSFWFKSASTISSLKYIISGSDSSYSDNFSIRVLADGLFDVYCGTNSTNNANTFTHTSWNHFAVLVYNTGSNIYCRIWNAGNRWAFTDSLLGTSYDNTTRLNIGVDHYINYDLYGDIDELRIYKGFIPTEAQIDSLHELTYRGGSVVSEYNPVAGRHARFFKDGIERKDTEGIYWKRKGVIDHGDTIHYFVYDDFESWTTQSVNTFDSLSTRWPIQVFKYNPSLISITDVGGDHGNVLKLSSLEGSTSGTDFNVMLADTASDIYFEYDMYVQSGMSGAGDGGNIGKMIQGFFATNNSLFFEDGTSTWDTVTTAGKGSWIWGVWGSSDNLMPYGHFQSGPVTPGSACGMCGQLYMPKGYWTRHLVHQHVNTPGQQDGYFEVWEKKETESVFRLKAVLPFKGRSVTQGRDFGNVEALHLSYFYNYPASGSYYIYLDNLCAYKTKPGHSRFGSGVGNLVLDGTYHATKYSDSIMYETNPPATRLAPKVSDLLYDENYTAISDTIYDVGNNRHYLYWPPNVANDGIITKTVYRSSGVIDFTFLTAEFGSGSASTEAHYYVKVYEGEGESKVLRYTFGNADAGYINPPADTWYTIEDNEATFEIHPGTGTVYQAGTSQRSARGTAIYYVNR